MCVIYNKNFFQYFQDMRRRTTGKFFLLWQQTFTILFSLKMCFSVWQIFCSFHFLRVPFACIWSFVGGFKGYFLITFVKQTQNFSSEFFKWIFHGQIHVKFCEENFVIFSFQIRGTKPGRIFLKRKWPLLFVVRLFLHKIF